MSHEVSRRKFLGLLGGTTAAVALASCEGGGQNKVQARELDEWVIDVAEDPTVFTNTLMPGGGVGSLRAQVHVMDGPILSEGPDMAIRPFLAKSWEVLDPRRIRLHIRDGVTFHNGDPVTAEDFQYSIGGAAANPKTSVNYFISAIKRVDVVDPLTVDLILSKPYSPIVYNFNFGAWIISKKARESMGVDAFNRRPVGAGAYRVTQDWTSGRPIRLERYDNYYQGKATPRNLTIQLVQDPSTRTAELLSGKAHLIENISIADIPLLEKSGKAEVREMKASEGLGRVIEYVLNPGRPFFADLRVRQAMNYAVDRESIVANILEGHGEPLAGFMPKGWTGYLPDIEPWPYDPGKARTLLQQAGFGDGFEFTWEITSGVFLRDREVAEAVAPMLKEVGIKANLRLTERAVQFDHYFTGDWDVNTLQWPTMKDPDGNVNWVFETAPPIIHYKPYDGVRELAGKARATYDETARKGIYEQLNRAAWNLCPMLYVQVQNEILAKDKRIPWQPYTSYGQGTEVWYYDREPLASKFFG